jgi:peptidoglycan/xylan/chitin deacetylase (PgdA/CDA1 family)
MSFVSSDQGLGKRGLRDLAVAQQFKALSHHISYVSGISAAMARMQSCSRIIMYHGISGKDAAVFADQLSYLSRNFRIVSLANMLEQIKANGSPAADEVVLTFDDGLRNNFSVVYPLLQKFKAPATFFVCPGLITSGKWLWNHEARCRLTTLGRVRLKELSRRLLAPSSSVEGLIAWMKTLSFQERRHAEEFIAVATRRFCPSASQHSAHAMMSWEELQSLDPELVTVGSHSFSHPILTTLLDEQLDFEMRESRRHLEEKLHRPVPFFCYPNGALDSRVHASAQKYYEAAVSTEAGTVGRDQLPDKHRLPRIATAETTALLAWRLHRPGA